MQFFCIIRRFFTIDIISVIVLQITCSASLCKSDTLSKNLNQDSLDGFIFIEGDIIVRKTEISGRTASVAVGVPWPNATIPFEIENTFDYENRLFIMFLMRKYHTLTNNCIRFRPRDKEDDYLLIKSHERKCASSMGFHKGVNTLVLGPWCLSASTILHELYHIIGFAHEQSRLDRDSYVTIRYMNIMKGKKHNFQKEPGFETFGIFYDYESIVHYNQYAFSANGQPTIIAENPLYQDKMGEYKDLSQKDIRRIKRKYKCK